MRVQEKSESEREVTFLSSAFLPSTSSFPERYTGRLRERQERERRERLLLPSPLLTEKRETEREKRGKGSERLLSDKERVPGRSRHKHSFSSSFLFISALSFLHSFPLPLLPFTLKLSSRERQEARVRGEEEGKREFLLSMVGYRKNSLLSSHTESREREREREQ